MRMRGLRIGVCAFRALGPPCPRVRWQFQNLRDTWRNTHPARGSDNNAEVSSRARELSSER
eukprot:2480298-Alexandrium_andersonii.AAC.1